MTKGERVSERVYDWQRWQLGIAETTKEMIPEKAIPLEHSLHHFHSFSFNKGCYLGQELMARVFHTGVLRKKVFPIVTSLPHETSAFLHTAPHPNPSCWLHDCDRPEISLPSSSPPSFPIVIKNQEGNSVGSLICGRGPLGLAMLRLEEFSLLPQKQSPSLFVALGESDQHTIPLQPILPSWFFLQ